MNPCVTASLFEDGDEVVVVATVAALVVVVVVVALLLTQLPPVNEYPLGQGGLLP